LEALEAKDPAKYQKILDEEQANVKASLANKAAESQAPPKDPRLLALDLKKSKAVENKKGKGRKSNFLDSKKANVDNRSVREMLGWKKKKKKKKKEGDEENEPPAEG
jgi:hypothetical protein